MGCFSFMCKECGKPVNSDSFTGQPVRLFLLKNGEQIDYMAGQYDSYGRVFDDNQDSIMWKLDWSEVCDLMFTESSADGIAAVHEKCWAGNVPTTESEGDPDQGWGDY